MARRWPAAAPPSREDDASDIIFTSGTTGKPKGAVLGHGASVRTYLAWSELVGLRRGDRYLVVYPFFHTAGLKSGLLACVLRGATIVPHAVFDVVPVMERVASERITMLPGPPTVFQSILNHPDFASFDLSSLRLSVTGAAIVPVDVIRRMRDELRFETVVTGYGLTETTGTVSMCRHDDAPEVIATTVGRPLPGVSVRIVDDAGQSVAPDDPGEILVRGFNVMKEYFEDPTATKEAIDEEGWLRTGDIGILGQDGNLRITDRKKDMYIVGGFNAYPAEIEGIMVGHPQVGQVAVVGVPDERLGEVGVAFVVPRPGQTVDPDELVALVPGPHGELQGAAFRPHRRLAPAEPHGQGHEVPAAGAARRVISGCDRWTPPSSVRFRSRPRSARPPRSSPTAGADRWPECRARPLPGARRGPTGAAGPGGHRRRGDHRRDPTPRPGHGSPSAAAASTTTAVASASARSITASAGRLGWRSSETATHAAANPGEAVDGHDHRPEPGRAERAGHPEPGGAGVGRDQRTGGDIFRIVHGGPARWQRARSRRSNPAASPPPDEHVTAAWSSAFGGWGRTVRRAGRGRREGSSGRGPAASDLRETRPGPSPSQ